jgi:N-acyl homoserine lactone hydrolase
MTDRMTLQIMPTGTMHTDLRWMLADPSLMASRQDTNRTASWVQSPTHCVYIDHPDGKIIWDAGVPPDWEQRWAPYGLNELFPVDQVTDDMWLQARLRQLGLEPGDVDYLLLSHLHFDHVGQADLWVDTDTTVIVSQPEFDGAFGYAGPALGGHVLSDYDRLRFTTVEGDTELLPGVTLLQTPGHTWGTMSLKVDLPDSGTMIFTSDAVYLDENYGPPVTAAGLVWDSRQWFASVEKIRALAEANDATVVFGHSAQQLRQLKTFPAKYT